MVPTDFIWFQSCTGLAFPTIFLQWPGRLDRSDWVKLEIVVTGRELQIKKTQTTPNAIKESYPNKGRIPCLTGDFFDANPNSKNGPSEPAPKFGKKQQSVY